MTRAVKTPQPFTCKISYFSCWVLWIRPRILVKQKQKIKAKVEEQIIIIPNASKSTDAFNTYSLELWLSSWSNTKNSAVSAI